MGDGRPDLRPREHRGAYYTAHLWRGIYISPDMQYIVNPGYNRDRGPVLVGAVRLHLEL